MDKKEIITVNMTFKVCRENSNYIENLFLNSSMTDLINYEVLPNTEHLKNDLTFKELVKKAKEAKNNKYEYINKKSK